MASKTPDLTLRRTRAEELLREAGSVLVALSGGVDSGVLLALAVKALGAPRVVAATAASPSLPAGELQAARELAVRLGVRHETVLTAEMEREAYRANRGDRCFHCRSELFESLGPVAARHGVERIVYGAITDDLGDVRPGMQAARLAGASAPLLEAGIGKRDVRAIAREMALPVSEKPAGACLASRIPAGVEVTPERLRQIDRAEAGLRRLGFRQLRVRHHGEMARLELDPEGMERIREAELRSAVVRVVRDSGFLFVTLDLEGYRTGSLATASSRRLYRIGPERDGGQ